MPKIEAVLFDLDGTLLDTAQDFADVVNQLLAQESRPAMDFNQVRRAVSHGSVGLIECAFQLSSDDPGFAPLRQRLLDLYLNCLTNKTRLFPGLAALLERLQQQQIPWGIVTNKPVLYTLPIVEGLGLKPAAVVCPDHVTHTKPHPESVQLACEQIGCRAENTVMIGDHLRDVEAGRNAGSITIAAAYGYLGEDEDAAQWQADYIAERSEDLLPLLETALLEQAL